MTILTSRRAVGGFLTDDMLERFAERAPIYDRENRFFDEDFEELRNSGYLTANVPADLRRFGDNSLEWLLREAADGEIFAAGHAEVGNDLPVLLSTSKAERVDGGYRITGHKMFGSLTQSGPASVC